MLHKKLILTSFIVATIAFSSAKAQDIIVTNGGETIKGYNLDIASSYIYYTLSPEGNAAVNRISKSDILIIKFADGRKFDPDADLSVESAAASIATAVAVTDGVVYPADKDLQNKEMIAFFNDNCNEAKALLKNPKKSKKGCGFLMFFDASDQSVLTDGLVSIELRPGRKSGKTFYPLSEEWFYAGVAVFKLVIKNNSTQPVFINLTDCNICRNGKADPLYTQTITSTTSISGTGIGVAVLPGVTVGGASGKATSTTTVSSQFVTIPAGAEYITDEILLWKYDSDNRAFSAFKNPEDPALTMTLNAGMIPGYKNRKLGEYNAYDKASSPLKIRANISYSFDSDLSGCHSLCADLFASECIFCNASSMGGIAYRNYYNQDIIPLPQNALISEFQILDLGPTSVLSGVTTR